MLRCPPSEIALSAADVHETVERLALRTASRQLVASTSSTRPRVLRGAERSRDDAVTCPLNQTKNSAIQPRTKVWAAESSLTDMSAVRNVSSPVSSTSCTNTACYLNPTVDEQCVKRADMGHLALQEELIRQFQVQLQVDGITDPTSSNRAVSTDMQLSTLQNYHPSSSPVGEPRVSKLDTVMRTDSKPERKMLRGNPKELRQMREGHISYRAHQKQPPHLTPDRAIEFNLSTSYESQLSKLQQSNYLVAVPEMHDSRISGRTQRPTLQNRVISSSTPNLGLDASLLARTPLPPVSTDDILPAGRHFNIRNMVSGSRTTPDMPLLELLRDRMSPLDRLEHAVAQHIPLAPSVSDFSTDSDSSDKAEGFRLPSFESPEQRPGKSMRNEFESPPRSSAASSSSSSGNSMGITPWSNSPCFSQTASDYRSRSADPRNSMSQASRDFSPSIPPRVTSRHRAGERMAIHQDHEQNAHFRRRDDGFFASHTIPIASSPTHSQTLPAWQIEQENSSSALERLMAAEFDRLTVRRRQESDEFMSTTPPRQGRFERIANGSQTY